MINCLLCALFASLSLQIFTLNYKLSFFNKTLINMPLSLLEVSVPLLESDGSEKLYFDKELLENYVTIYFQKNINEMCGPYTLSYYYYSTSDNLYCKSDKCDGVRITLEADILIGITYSRTMSYHLKENNNG